MSLPPCIRHGDSGIEDSRILNALAIAKREVGALTPDELASLVDYDGQLWATWRTPELGRRHGTALAAAWARVGGDRGALHLVRSDEDYDYQEDCMNDASQEASG